MNLNTKEYTKLIKRIDESFAKLNGKPLPSPPDTKDRYKWLTEEAPYSILTHNTDKDPSFIYVNEYALKCFKYSLNEMIGLPSRLSAAEKDREERQRLLNKIEEDGIAYNYNGPRVDKNGKFFQIYDGILWQVTDEDGKRLGTGALFWTNKDSKPDWYTKDINMEG